MSIHFLFTKNSLVGSKIIRWGLRENSSHFAIGFDLGSSNRGIIFHSNFHGLKIDWANDFLKKNDIIHQLEPVLDLKLEAEERLYQAVVKNYGKAYDYKGFFFFILAAAWGKITRRELPRRNPWGDNRAFLCTEVAEEMRAELLDIFQVTLPHTRGALSPGRLYETLKTSPFLKRVFQWKI